MMSSRFDQSPKYYHQVTNVLDKNLAMDFFIIIFFFWFGLQETEHMLAFGMSKSKYS